MSAFSYDAAKKQVEPERDAGQQREARPPASGRQEAERDEHGQRSELVDRQPEQVTELAGQVAERVDEAALELLAEGDVPEAIPRVGPAVDQRSPEGPGAQGELQVDDRHGDGKRGDAGEDESAPLPDRRLDGEHEEADRRAP